MLSSVMQGLNSSARYQQMALLVIDPQGEFAKDVRGKPSGDFALPLGGILRSLQKKPIVLSVRNLVLDTWALFEQTLFESPFFERLSIPRGENRQLACGMNSVPSPRPNPKNEMRSCCRISNASR
jgi:hypothetical protein